MLLFIYCLMLPPLFMGVCVGFLSCDEAICAFTLNVLRLSVVCVPWVSLHSVIFALSGHTH